MVVCQDDGRGVVLDRLAEYLRRADDRRVHVANIHRVCAQDLVFGVEQHDAQFFLPGRAHLGHKVVSDVGRARDAWPRIRQGGSQSPAQFERRKELSGLGGSYAWDLAQLSRTGCGQPLEATERGQQTLRHSDGVLPPRASTQGDGDQLGIAERCGAVRLKTLAGTFGLRELAQRTTSGLRHGRDLRMDGTGNRCHS